MNYSIMYAKKGENVTMCLDRCGGEGFRISCYNKEKHATTYSEWFNTNEYDKAENRFVTLCKANGFSDPVTIEHDVSDFDVWCD